MCNRYQRSTRLQLFLFTALAIVCVGGLQVTVGQGPLPGAGVSRITRAPNPKVNRNHVTPKNPAVRAGRPDATPKLSPEAEKQQAIEDAIERGNNARDEKDYQLAMSSYRKVTDDLKSDDARAFYGMGNVYAELYCSDSAIEAYLKAVKLKPGYFEAMVGLGYAYLSKELYDDAKEQFEAVAAQKVEAKIGLGIVQAMKRNYPEALKQLNFVINDKSAEAKDRAAACVALGDVFWKQEKWPETIAEYEQAISLNPKLANAYVSLGGAQMSYAAAKFSTTMLEYVKVQDREMLAVSAKQAAANIEKAISKYKYNNPNGYLFLSYALMYQERYEEATGEINRYLAEVKKLESQLTPLVSRCEHGFNRLNADGHSFQAFVSLNESLFETNNQRKSELLKTAAEQYVEAIKLRPDYAVTYNMLGMIYSMQGQNKEAIEQYEKAILLETEPLRKAGSYNSLGLKYLELRRYDEALGSVQEAIRLNPNNPSLYESLATIYVVQGNLDETFNSLKRANELRTTPAANPGPYYYLGSTYLIRFIKKKNEADFNDAIKWLRKAIEIRPNYASAYTALGLAFEQHRDPDEALASFKKASDYNPKDSKSYLNMAEVYSDLKQNDDAASGLLKQAIELKPDYAEAHYRLGLIYRRKHNDTEAIAEMLDAIRYDGKYVDAYLTLADIYKARKDYGGAVKLLETATEIAPTNFQPYKELAKVYELQGKNEEAIKHYQQAINNLSVENLFGRELYVCRIERLRGHHAEAIACFQKLKLTAGEDPGQLIYEIGLTYVAGNNKKAALLEQQKLVELKSALAEELLQRISEMK